MANSRTKSTQPASATMNSCPVLRRVLITKGTMALGSSEIKIAGQCWAIKPCDVPLFSADKQVGKCRSCVSGWTHPHNQRWDEATIATGEARYRIEGCVPDETDPRHSDLDEVGPYRLIRMVPDSDGLTGDWTDDENWIQKDLEAQVYYGTKAEAQLARREKILAGRLG